MFAKLRDFSVFGEYVTVPYYELRRILGEALRLEERFSSEDPYADYLRSFLSDWFCYFDVLYAWKRGLQYWQVLDAWLSARKGFEKSAFADCDKYARAFAALCALRYGFNAALVVLGVVRYEGGESGHAWNLLVPMWSWGDPPTEAYASLVYVDPITDPLLSGIPSSDGTWRIKLGPYELTYVPYAVLG